jgi:hypothetical protein
MGDYVKHRSNPVCASFACLDAWKSHSYVVRVRHSCQRCAPGADLGADLE